jgi:hypothetical protein
MVKRAAYKSCHQDLLHPNMPMRSPVPSPLGEYIVLFMAIQAFIENEFRSFVKIGKKKKYTTT